MFVTGLIIGSSVGLAFICGLVVAHIAIYRKIAKTNDISIMESINLVHFLLTGKDVE